MRKCLRCNEAMIEKFVGKAGGYKMILTQDGLFKNSIGTIQFAVCPKCGYVENYIEDVSQCKLEK